MINQDELQGYVEKEIPELAGLVEKAKCRNAYDMMREMVKYTGNQLMANNVTAAKKCLNLAEQLYIKGNNAIRNAIENVFVYSFSHSFFYDDAKKKSLMRILPIFLYELYKKQLVNSHL